MYTGLVKGGTCVDTTIRGFGVGCPGTFRLSHYQYT